MQEIESIGIHRRGGENDPKAVVVLHIQDSFGDWWEVGTEELDANFSHNWTLPFPGAKRIPKYESTREENDV